MRDLRAYRNAAIRYWETRRLVYNALLALPAIVGYAATAELPSAVGDPEHFGMGQVAWLFFLSALGANICYTFAYALEFHFGSDEPASRWLRCGRTCAFVVGTLIAMLLAFEGGRTIGLLQYP